MDKWVKKNRIPLKEILKECRSNGWEPEDVKIEIIALEQVQNPDVIRYQYKLCHRK